MKKIWLAFSALINYVWSDCRLPWPWTAPDLQCPKSAAWPLDFELAACKRCTKPQSWTKLLLEILDPSGATPHWSFQLPARPTEPPSPALGTTLVTSSSFEIWFKITKLLNLFRNLNRNHHKNVNRKLVSQLLLIIQILPFSLRRDRKLLTFTKFMSLQTNGENFLFPFRKIPFHFWENEKNTKIQNFVAWSSIYVNFGPANRKRQ